MFCGANLISECSFVTSRNTFEQLIALCETHINYLWQEMDNLYCEKQEVIHTVLIKSLRPVQNDTVELLSLQVCFKSHLLKSG